MATRENFYAATEPEGLFWPTVRGIVAVDPSRPPAYIYTSVKDEPIAPAEMLTCAEVQLAPLEEVFVKTEPIEEDPCGPGVGLDHWDPRLLPELAVKLEANWDPDNHVPVGAVNTGETHNLDCGQTEERSPVQRQLGTDSPVAESLPHQDMPPPATACTHCKDLQRLATPAAIAFLEKLLDSMKAVTGQMPRRHACGPTANGSPSPIGPFQDRPSAQPAKQDKTELVAGSGVFINSSVIRRLVLKHSEQPSALARALFAELVPDLKSVTAQGQRGKPAVPADVRHSVETFVTDMVERKNRASPTRRVALPKYSEIINRKAASLRRMEKRKIYPGYGRYKNGRRADTQAAHRSPRKVTKEGASGATGADAAVGSLPSPMVVSEEIKSN